MRDSSARLTLWQSLRIGPTIFIVFELENGDVENGYIAAMRGDEGEILLARCAEELTEDSRCIDRWKDPRYRTIQIGKVLRASIFPVPFEVVKRGNAPNKN